MYISIMYTLPIQYYKLCIIRLLPTNSVDSFNLITNRIRMELYL